MVSMTHFATVRTTHSMKQNHLLQQTHYQLHDCSTHFSTGSVTFVSTHLPTS
jgi:hypothetical protein